MRVLHRSLSFAAPLGAALALLGAGAPALAATTAVYAGHAKGGDAIVLTVDAKTLTLRSAVLAWRLTCADGTRVAFHEQIPAKDARAIPVGTLLGSDAIVLGGGPKGTIRGTLLGSSDIDTGSGPLTGELRGRLGPKSGSGTFSASVTYQPADPAGAPFTCSTGRIAWTTSHRPGRVYGGRTQDQEPVTIALSADRRTVRTFDLGWHHACAPSGWVDVPESLTLFPIDRSGRFGDSWTHTFSDGTVAYKLAGRLTRTTGSGTFSAIVKATAGMTCDSGRQTWSVRSS